MQNTSELTNAPYNPRKITDEAIAGLGYSLAEFGDLSGIVVNKRADGVLRLIAGHQRLRAIREKWGDLPIENGAITLPTGERFAVRVVEWEDAKEREACIAANSQTIQGTWTPDLFPLLDDIKLTDAPVFETLNLDALYTLPFDLIEGAEVDTPPKKAKEITCPHCGQSFTP